jgi:SOS response regulatory protein OraA/RecX
MLQTRRKRYLELDRRKARQRMTAFLLRRGFSREVVWEAVDQVTNDKN